MSLRAPLAVVVEIRADDRRWFRLSRNVGDDGVTLQRPLPLEPGRPVEMRLLLPLAAGPTGAGGDAAAPAPPTDEATLLARAEVVAEDGDDPHGQGGGRGLLFLEPSRDRRAAIARYVKERLALHLS